MSILEKISNAVFAPLRAGQSILEAVNPWDTESKGNKVIDKANSAYNFTPEFKSILDRANPRLNPGQWQNNNNLSGSQAAANYMPDWNPASISRIQLSDSNPNTLVHEGLHAAWNPENAQRFRNEVLPQLESIPMDPSAANYIRYRMSNYKNYMPNMSLADQPDLTEVHSYLPEYYMTVGRPMPSAVSNYYSQFWNNPIGQIKNNTIDVPQKTRNAIENTLHPRNPFAPKPEFYFNGKSITELLKKLGPLGLKKEELKKKEELPPLTNRYNQ